MGLNLDFLTPVTRQRQKRKDPENKAETLHFRGLMKTPPVGLEGVSLTELSANELRDAVQQRGTESGTLLTRVVEQPEADAGLRLLTEVWDELSDSVRNRILMLADESLGAVVR